MDINRLLKKRQVKPSRAACCQEESGTSFMRLPCSLRQIDEAYLVPDRKPHIFENMGTNPCLVLAFFGVICGQNFLLRHVVEIGSHLR